MKIFTCCIGIIMTQIPVDLWRQIAEELLEMSAMRVASYFDLALKNSPEGEERMKHVIKVNNEKLRFYKIPEEELKNFWESVEKKPFSIREYTAAEERELHVVFEKLL